MLAIAEVDIMASWTEADLKDEEGNKYEKVIFPLPGDQFQSKDGKWLPIEEISRDRFGKEIKVRRKIK